VFGNRRAQHHAGRGSVAGQLAPGVSGKVDSRTEAQRAAGLRGTPDPAASPHAPVGPRREDDVHPCAGVRRAPTPEDDHALPAVEGEDLPAQALDVRPRRTTLRRVSSGSNGGTPNSAASASSGSAAITVTEASRCAGRPA
jgi:hypothetical protein